MPVIQEEFKVAASYASANIVEENHKRKSDQSIDQPPIIRLVNSYDAVNDDSFIHSSPQLSTPESMRLAQRAKVIIKSANEDLRQNNRQLIIPNMS